MYIRNFSFLLATGILAQDEWTRFQTLNHSALGHSTRETFATDVFGVDVLGMIPFKTDHARLGPSPKVEAIFDTQFPVSVAVSKMGRKFISFPRWDQNKGPSLSELMKVENNDGNEISNKPYPNDSMNSLDNNEGFHSVHALVIDSSDRLWVLNTGKVSNDAMPVSKHRFFVYRLSDNQLDRVYTFPKDVELEKSTLQDIRFDAELKYGFITDSGVPGIVVLELATGNSYRRLHKDIATTANPNYKLVIEGQFITKPDPIHSNGVAVSNDHKLLYFSPIFSRCLYSVPTDSLIDTSISDTDLSKQVTTVIHDKGSATSGMTTDGEGRIYMASLTNNAILVYDPIQDKLEPLVRHPAFLWPDTLSIHNKTLYFTTNQMHHREAFWGEDTRQPPFFLFSVPINATDFY